MNTINEGCGGPETSTPTNQPWSTETRDVIVSLSTREYFDYTHGGGGKSEGSPLDIGFIISTEKYNQYSNRYIPTEKVIFVSVEEAKRQKLASGDGDYTRYPAYISFSMAVELMKLGYSCRPACEREYVYCFGVCSVEAIRIPDKNRICSEERNHIFIKKLEHPTYPLESGKSYGGIIDGFSIDEVLSLWVIDF